MGKEMRIQWLDFVRAIAILGVLMCHATESIYDLNLEDMGSLARASRWFAFSAFSLGRLGVPLFLMITGYLLLDREYSKDAIKRFWKDKWLHLLICTEMWWILYELFLLSRGHTFSIAKIVTEMLFIRPINYFSHAWYLPTILGYYILIPFVADGLHSLDSRLLRFPIIFFAGYAFGFPFLTTICNALRIGSLSQQMSLGYSGGCYGLYILLGYVIKKDGSNKTKSETLALLALLSFMLTVLFQIWCYRWAWLYNTWYDNPFLLVCAACVFVLCSQIVKVPGYRVWHFLSHYSFAVYLLHNIFRYLLRPLIRASSMPRPVEVFLLWASLLALSYPTAWMISKIPKVGKYILYMR